ncbi:MAG: NAD(P)H-binding protein [Anaerolineaceae bacterium]|nr:NAD(P)H-binding protein [Anaerolineaceae bacterium]
MILVTGATGFVGRQLVAQLMAEGRAVRCLLPDYRLKNLPWEKLPEIVVGSLLDEETLFQATTGVHVIIHLESAQWWGRPRDLERVELGGLRGLITAARAARVGRIITLSHLGASSSSAYALLRYKGLVEDQVRASGLAYTVIRSGILFGEEDAFINHIAMTMRVTPLVFLMPGRGEVVLHPLSVQDVVTATITSLDAVDTVDTVLEIGGAEYITLEDLIHTVMRVTGTSRLIVSVPPYILRWLTTIYSRLFPRSLMTGQWLDILAANRSAPLGNTYTYFGLHPRRLEDTLLTYMPQKRYFWSALRYTIRRRPRGI